MSSLDMARRLSALFHDHQKHVSSIFQGQAVCHSKGFEVMRTMEIDDDNEEGGKLKWQARAVENDP